MIQRSLRSDGICVLTFDRPGSTANIFDQPTLNAFASELDYLESSPPKGLVIASGKPSVFLAGADLRSFDGEMPADEVRAYIELGQLLMNRLARLAIPTAAAIQGAALGGGYELCLACDWRVASTSASTRVGLPETTLGLLPAWGGTTRLPRLIGFEKALDLVLTGKVSYATEALRLGLVDQVAPSERLLEVACGMLTRKRAAAELIPTAEEIERIASERRGQLHARRQHNVAAMKALEVMALGLQKSEESSLAAECEGFMELLGTESTRNLLRLFFLEDRARKPDHDAGERISKIAVIGAGVMGAGIAYWASTRGLRVQVVDSDPLALARGRDRIAKLEEGAARRGIVSEAGAAERWARIAFTGNIEEALAGAEVVIEAVVEKLDVKRAVFERLDQGAPAGALLATNTSALPVTCLAAATSRPAQVVGLHFFNPVHRMRLVEVVAGVESSVEALRSARRFVQQIGKLPVLVRDSPGFVVNRVLFPYLLEAARLLDEGETAEAVDGAMLEFGMAMGPLRVIDEVGLDVALDIAATLQQAFGERAKPPDSLVRLAAAGHLGRKSGQGFYRHGGSAGPVAGAAKAAVNAPALKNRDLRRRMVFLMVNEAARCLEEKVVGYPGDIDLAMILGAAFPAFRGGPLRYSDALGNRRVADEMNRLAATRPLFSPCVLLRELGARDARFYS